MLFISSTPTQIVNILYIISGYKITIKSFLNWLVM